MANNNSNRLKKEIQIPKSPHLEKVNIHKAQTITATHQLLPLIVETLIIFKEKAHSITTIQANHQEAKIKILF